MLNYWQSWDNMIDIKHALDLAINQLAPYSDSARIDAEVLLALVLAKPRAYLYAHPEALMSSQQWLHFEKFIARRSLGTPVPYLTGMREFWSLPLKVSEETLIPRPETELLVELTLQNIQARTGAHILDLGTGCGAIAIALAKERKDWFITACDFSEGALNVAKENANQLNLQNITFFHSDWFSSLGESPQFFHAIVSNPPYIAANDPHLQQGSLPFEPQSALVGGSDGLTALEHIVKHSLARLEPDGLLLIEHGATQGNELMAMMRAYGYIDVHCWQDLHGNDRVCSGKKKLTNCFNQ